MADYGDLTEHADAVMALLYSADNLTVYPAEAGGPQLVPRGAAPPYVSVHMEADRPLGGRLSMRSTRMRMRIYCHCVGANDQAARGVVDQVSAALLDVRPDIAGRSVYPIRSEPGRDPRADDSTGTSVVTITSLYRLESDPGVDGS